MNISPIKPKRAPRKIGLTAKITGLVHPEKATQQIVVDHAYRKWIRSLPCAICGSRRQIEFAHQKERGLSQKSSDVNGIPLCAHCHRTGRFAQHQVGTEHFWQFHKHIDLDALIEQLNRAYALLKESTALDTGGEKENADTTSGT